MAAIYGLAVTPLPDWAEVPQRQKFFQRPTFLLRRQRGLYGKAEKTDSCESSPAAEEPDLSSELLVADAADKPVQTPASQQHLPMQELRQKRDIFVPVMVIFFFSPNFCSDLASRPHAEPLVSTYIAEPNLICNSFLQVGLAFLGYCLTTLLALLDS